MSAPLVSVCIPTYRGAATIGPAIESVLAQSMGDFELLVFDDASPDATPDVVARYDDPRIAYLRNERNLGPEGNWNRCLERARGRYFKLLPHDDLLGPDCLAKQAAVLEADSAQAIALVFCAREVIGPDGRRLTQRGYPGARTGVLPAADVLRLCVRRGTNLIGEPGAVMFRKALADRVGLFDARDPYVVDLEYWARLLAQGDAYYIDEALASFRVSAAQWSVAIGSGQSRDFRRWVDRAARTGGLPTRWGDRLIGTVTPSLNTLGRLAFYRLYLGRGAP